MNIYLVKECMGSMSLRLYSSTCSRDMLPGCTLAVLGQLQQFVIVYRSHLLWIMMMLTITVDLK